MRKTLKPGSNGILIIGGFFIFFLLNFDLKTAEPPGIITRKAPNYYIPGKTIILTNSVVPLANVSFYIIQESVPVNWTPSEISHNGFWDKTQNLIKWGPFFDNNVRNLTFKLTPPASATGRFLFSGVGIFNATMVSIGGVQFIDPLPPAAGSVIRYLPGGYKSGATIVATNEVRPDSGIMFYVVEEFLPAGTVFVFASDGGVWDGKKIRWGPFTDDRMRRLTFTLIAPTNTTNTITFYGKGIFDTNHVQIGGDSSLVWLPSGGGTITRNMRSYYYPGAPVTITNQANPDQEVQFYAVEESLPSGWTFQSANLGGNYNQSTGKIKWGPFTDSEPRTFIYTLIAPTNATGIYFFSGTAWFQDVVVTIGGKDRISNAPPATGTSIRLLPAEYIPTLEHKVTNSVVPDFTVIAYGVEEIIPANWTATNINYGGSFNPQTSKIQWGPFFDNEPRILTYTVIPPYDAAGIVYFSGKAVFNGGEIQTQGDQFVKPPSITKGRVKRVCPAFFIPGVSFFITNEVQLTDSVVIYAIEEQIPAGVTTNGFISHGGFYDQNTGKIKWGPFIDSIPRLLVYGVIPSENATNALLLTGNGIFDGAVTPIGGLDQVYPDLPPVISEIPAQTTFENIPVNLTFSVSDNETPITNLIVSASSSNQSLIPDSNLILGWYQNYRTLRIVPNFETYGQTLITITVRDDVSTVIRQFTVTVEQYNNPPFIENLPSELLLFEDNILNITNLIANDYDIGSEFLFCRFETSVGRVALKNTNQFQILSGSNNSTNFAFLASLMAFNSALAEITYTPELNYSGIDRLKITLSDRGFSGPGGTQSVVYIIPVQVLPVNDPPVLTKVNPILGGIKNTPFEITYDTLLRLADAFDIEADLLSFRITTIDSGYLLKNGQPVIPGTTLLNTGESLLWIPPQNSVGLINVFKVRAFDGLEHSSTPVQVKVLVGPFTEIFVDDDYAGLPEGTAVRFPAISNREFIIGYEAVDSIQKGIDLVQTNGIVYVAPGTYNENVKINKKGIKVLSCEGPGSTIINLPSSLHGGVIINAPDVSIQGFTIKDDSNGNFIFKNINVKIERPASNCIVKGNVLIGNLGLPGILAQTHYGVFVSGNSAGIVSNEIKNFGYTGVYVSGSESTITEANIISNIGLYGIVIEQSPSNIITGNLIRSLTGGTLWSIYYPPSISCWGISVGGNGSRGTVIRNQNLCNIYNGINLAGTKAVTVINSSFTSNQTGILISDNKIFRNDSDENIISQCFIQFNKYGIVVTNVGFGAILSNNKIIGNNISENELLNINNQVSYLILNCPLNYYGVTEWSLLPSLISINNVDYSPMLLSSSDIEPFIPGFQPQYSPLFVDYSSPGTGVMSPVEEAKSLFIANNPPDTPIQLNVFITNSTVSITDEEFELCDFNVANNGILQGSGTIRNISVENGGILNPGINCGLMNASSVVFGPGGYYNWEINNGNGIAGDTNGWDLLNINGVLIINATESQRFTIAVNTLNFNNNTGPAEGFDHNKSNSWVIIRATQGIVGFTIDKFNLLTNNFINPLYGGKFCLAKYGNEILLTFTPNLPPTASIISDIRTFKNSSPATFHLRNFFTDLWTASDELLYSIVYNSNPSLVAPSIDNISDILKLVYRSNMVGTAKITIRATDTGGRYVDATFSVDVFGSEAEVPNYFRDGINYFSGVNPVSIASADINGDGFKDIIVANLSTNTLTVLKGNGIGSFSMVSQLTVENGPVSVIVDDFNGDIIPDIAVACTNGKIAILFGNGAGTFSEPDIYNVGGTPVKMVSINLDYLNGNDLVVSLNSVNSLITLLNNGNGTFRHGQTYNTGNSPYGLAVGLLNQDTIFDLVVANTSDHTISVFFGNGNGGFIVPSTNIPVGLYPIEVVVGKINSDAFNDIGVLSKGTAEVISLYGNGKGVFPAQSKLNTGNEPLSFTISDINKDYKTDYIVVNGESSSLWILPGGSAPGESYKVGTQPVAVLMEDFNNDGALDIAVANFDSDTITILMNAVALRAFPSNFTILEDVPEIITIQAWGKSPRFLFDTYPSKGYFSTISTNNLFLTLKYVPNADFFGSDSFKFHVEESGRKSAQATVNIKILPVNDPPSFNIKTQIISTVEDSPIILISDFAYNISKGAFNEASQPIKFLLFNNNSNMFSVQPHIRINGSLVFRIKPDAHGTANVNAYLVDSGGRANNGNDTSKPRQFNIIVQNINDPPNLKPLEKYFANRTAWEDTTIVYRFEVSDIESSPNSLLLTVTSTNQSLVPASAIQIVGAETNRTVSITPAENRSGITLLTFILSDGTNFTSKTSLLKIQPVNDPPYFELLHESIAWSSRGGRFSGQVIKTDTISTGPDNEYKQNYTFSVFNIENPDLFIGIPVIDRNGILYFMPRKGITGRAKIGINMVDSGGVLNGGINTYGPLFLNIEITQ